MSDSKNPMRGRSGGLAATIAVASLACGAAFALIDPGMADLDRLVPGWLEDLLLTDLGLPAPAFIPTFDLDFELPRYTWTRGDQALVGALLPFLVALLVLYRQRCWRRAVLRSEVGVAREAGRARRAASANPIEPSASELARALLAERGIKAGPDAPPRRGQAEPDFAEAEAAARLLLRQLGQKP